MVIMSPAVEKILSAGTLVPGMHICCWASLARSGYTCACDFHHISGSSVRGKEGASWYCFTSLSAIDDDDAVGMALF